MKKKGLDYFVLDFIYRLAFYGLIHFREDI